MKAVRGLIFFAVLPLNMMGYLYELNLMRKWDGQRGLYHYFVGFSDFHGRVSLIRTNGYIKI